MKVISLGWGVQSFTLAAMAALGELQVDAVVHADTTHESKLTYEFARRWNSWLEQHEIRVVTVSSNNPVIIKRGRGKIYIPAYSKAQNGFKDGQLRRQCTEHWKISPMRRWFQLNRNKNNIEMLLGISVDEFQRMKQSDVKYITNIYPLVDKRMSRLDCINWLEKHNLEVPSKSACVFCPYHNSSEWRTIKNTQEDWEKAIETDKNIRNARHPYNLFVHPARIPLCDVDLEQKKTKDNRHFGTMSVLEYVEYKYTQLLIYDISVNKDFSYLLLRKSETCILAIMTYNLNQTIK